MKIIGWITFCLLTLYASADVMEIYTMSELRPYLDEEVFVIFDVDMVLVQTKDPAFQMGNMKQHRKIVHAITKDLTPDEKDHLVNLMVVGSEAILIDEETPKVFQEITKRGIKVIALTASYTGSLGSIENMGEWRIKTLRGLGYDFTDSFPFVKKKTFTQFPKVNGDYPRFDQGILFVNGGAGKYTKGDVLEAFFLHSDFMPKKVLFVDDRRPNLEAVERTLPKEVEFLGFHYLGGASYRGETLSEEVFKASWESLR
ncbi:MAG: DUF2608 domain-containing protein [Simkaniaceae bacterium]|nr:MAG: DUF2608 domain-containing protein [Simkaniaceae bacterium]